MEENFSVSVYGSRGSRPSPDMDKMAYGGNTSCFYVQIGERRLVLDCGTGAVSLGNTLSDSSRLDILFSHMHFDHILGIPFFAPFFTPNQTIYLYGEARGGFSLKHQISQLMQAPFWPVGTEVFPANFHWMDFSCGDRLDLGDGILVSTQRSNHPDQSTLYRIEARGKSLVYALDYEHGPQANQDLACFAKGCDLLIFDAQFTDEEYGRDTRLHGWGHSTWQEGVRVAAACGARLLLLAHHNPDCTDSELVEREKEARRMFAGCVFAREGQVIEL